MNKKPIEAAEMPINDEVTFPIGPEILSLFR
jgi:hypothetical protein